jgi:N6-L-threonylcarbamoyladenine synthase
MKILGIETSCDETAAAIIEIKNGKIDILSSIVSSQIEIHKKYGGVVPEVAAREHAVKMISVLNEALEKAKIPHPPFRHPPINRRGKSVNIDLISVTQGPGLITSLMTGVETARVLSFVWGVPLVGVNHIEGHIYANFVGKFPISNFQFPILVLTVSGGHTMLVLMKGHGKYEILGETRDDAAGEAFDKAAKLLELAYPGGPEIAKYAEKYLRKHPKISNFQFPISKQIQSPKFKNTSRINLPRPMLSSNNLDFSFSGLKTALLYELKKDKHWKKRVPEYAFEFQQAVIDVLIHKTMKAQKKTEAKTIMLTGGVAANRELREQLKQAVEKRENIKLLIPDLEYTTDNAAMIAVVGYFRAKQKKFVKWENLKADCNLELK